MVADYRGPMIHIPMQRVYRSAGRSIGMKARGCGKERRRRYKSSNNYYVIVDIRVAAEV